MQHGDISSGDMCPAKHWRSITAGRIVCGIVALEDSIDGIPGEAPARR